jgi:hypothetical protein
MLAHDSKRQRLSESVTVIDDNSDFESPSRTSRTTIFPTCFVCGASFQTFSSEKKECHLNSCLKKLETDESCGDKSDTKSNGLRAESYSCVICDLNLSKRCLSARCQHLKRCAKQYGVGVRDLLQMIAPDKYEEIILTQQGSTEPIQRSDSTVIDLCEDEPRAVEEITQPQKPNFMSVLMANAKSVWGSASAAGCAAVSVPLGGSVLSSKPTSSSTSNPNPKTAAGAGGTYNAKRKAPSSSAVSSAGGDEGGAALPRYTPDYKKVAMAPMTVPVIVDGFNYASPSLSDCYFLTHFHSDHYTGLDRSFDSGECVVFSMRAYVCFSSVFVLPHKFKAILIILLRNDILQSNHLQPRETKIWNKGQSTARSCPGEETHHSLRWVSDRGDINRG